MSNHFSAANLKFPGDDARLDLTDLYVFSAPGDPDRTELIMDANPFMTGSEFHPDAVYRINIDNDRDLHAGRLRRRRQARPGRSGPAVHRGAQ
jgi:Domain of unknown function (DUF4331)